MSRQNESSREEKMPPDHIGVLIIGVLLMVSGWGGLYVLITTALPRIGGPLWAFFMLLTAAVTGTVLPFVRYLNMRFTPIYAPLPSGGVLVRQSVWIAVFIATCAWLQILRALSWPIGFFLALVLIVIEIFLRTREVANDRE